MKGLRTEVLYTPKYQRRLFRINYIFVHLNKIFPQFLRFIIVE